jgi:hypothetical protein
MGPEAKDGKEKEERRLDIKPDEFESQFGHLAGTMTRQQLIDVRVAEYLARNGMPKKSTDLSKDEKD